MDISRGSRRCEICRHHNADGAGTGRNNPDDPNKTLHNGVPHHHGTRHLKGPDNGFIIYPSALRKPGTFCKAKTGHQIPSLQLKTPWK
ncbi:hypothetical protein GDO78_002771 [Eleutherodactylus coqui]|uniref:Uncharacterized protein n=1 Tax=Eleutherodactylus coqui TaxID=57060 RepID=A0A8J6EZ13_ELECQ|nr:hypothetical protein GDO78_002771 [Eleutherodactylus coqui]